ncbi:hypothetical protein [Streptomyces sp. YS415]|uniref:hypothetical protein n=1 Tax=Streptomyces sp. YS415 TaxID=2944806 RepID=UPI0020212879|nr:hypothetical protein [Streptomyces sp. YS415]MCL7427044.1 hypothetical protein [Streptomyces sp. YS415]
MNGRQRSAGTRFAIDLGDVQLPPMTVKAVEAEIRSVVLRAIAALDSGGQRAKDKDWHRFPGGTAGGVWSGPTPRSDACFLCGQPLPGPWPPPEGGEELSPQDHTLILRAIMAHPKAVVANLNGREGSANPSGTEVLEAALQVDQIDPYTKERIEAVLDVLPKVEGARNRMPTALQRSVKELQERITDRSIPERVRVLRESRSRYRSSGMAEGLELAAQILEDGASSIYSPGHPFFRMLKESPKGGRKSSLRDMADAIPATVAGAVGVVAEGVGADHGAVAASTKASARVVIRAFINRR